MEQMVNELRSLLQGMNEKYKEFYHVNLLTIVDLKEDSCEKCITAGAKCLRAVIGHDCPDVAS
jgi:hypothetical protein